MTTRAVITVATGKPTYLAYAANLARSFRHWHGDGGIEFHLVTDLRDPLPEDLAFVRVHRAERGSIGASFTSKLHLDRFLPCDENLFVDADCLCVGPLDGVFERFRGRDFSAIGAAVDSGEWFGDIAFRCRAVGVPWTVRFCGSVYFIRRGPAAAEIFAFARGLEPRYAELGMVLLRDAPNEEPLLALAMAKFAQAPVDEDGAIKADLMFFNAPPAVDVVRGRASVQNDPRLPKPYADWNIPDRAEPVLMHFNAGFTEFPPYTSEARRLELLQLRGWPEWLATAWVAAFMRGPHAVFVALKALGRPLYRRLFGFRAIERSSRQ